MSISLKHNKWYVYHCSKHIASVIASCLLALKIRSLIILMSLLLCVYGPITALLGYIHDYVVCTTLCTICSEFSWGLYIYSLLLVLQIIILNL